MSNAEHDQLRDALIEKIEAAFPATTFSGKLFNNYGYIYQNERLTETLKGRIWPDVVSNPKIFYYLSDVDFLRAISADAYQYYLPALLIATLLSPEGLIHAYGTYQQISEIATNLTVKQLKAIMGYLEYQDKLLNMDENLLMRNFDLETIIQETYLGLLNLLYEQGPRAMRDE